MSADVSAGLLPAYSAVDLWAMKSIFNKGFGCNSCSTGTNQHSYSFISSPSTSTAASAATSTHAYITSPGYDGLPTYAEMKSERVLLNRRCGPYPNNSSDSELSEIVERMVDNEEELESK